MTGIQGAINSMFSSVAALTLLDCCWCYLEGTWTHLGYLNSVEAPRWDRGRSSDNGRNCTRLGKQQNVLWKKKMLYLGLSGGLFMERAPALWNGDGLVGRASLPSWESHARF